MPSLEEENEAALANILKRAKLERHNLPKLIKDLDADIKLKKLKKEIEGEQDKTRTGKLIRVAKVCEDAAKFFVQKKLYSEMQAPSTNLIRAPTLTSGGSDEAFVALAIVVQIFLLKLQKRKSPKPR